jgi:hypothetical protein
VPKARREIRDPAVEAGAKRRFLPLKSASSNMRFASFALTTDIFATC